MQHIDQFHSSFLYSSVFSDVAFYLAVPSCFIIFIVLHLQTDDVALSTKYISVYY